MDRDTEANGKVSYSIIQSNSEVISVKEETGEIFLIQPASSSHTSRGQYELVIRATDHGKFVLCLFLSAMLLVLSNFCRIFWQNSEKIIR